jgi:hypothetical protein
MRMGIESLEYFINTIILSFFTVTTQGNLGKIAFFGGNAYALSAQGRMMENIGDKSLQLEGNGLKNHGNHL